MKEDIKISVEEGVKALELRTGELLKQHDFKEVSVSGTIETPLRFLENPSEYFDEKLIASRLEVKESEGELKLVVHENYHPTDTYNGKLELTEEFLRFAINTGKSFTTFQLADLFKMNRSFFEKKQDAMKLVTDLRQFQAKVSQDIEKADDTRGNAKIKKIQAVESNIPESFKLNISIFKGQPAVKFEVEIAIDADDLSCTLVSPDANDYQQTTKKSLLEGVVSEIKKLFPTLRVFHV